jgi:hypothetical protein
VLRQMTTQPTRPHADAADGDPSVAAPRENDQLTQSTILRAALAIVDRDRVDGSSMCRLSDALGRDPVMIYRHVPNKPAAHRRTRLSAAARPATALGGRPA